MFKAVFENAQTATRLLTSLLIILGSFLLVSLFGTLLALLVFRMDPSVLLGGVMEPGDPGTMGLLRFLQVVQSVGLFFIPSFLIAWMYHSRPAVFLGFERRPWWPSLVAGSLVLVAALPLVNLLADWNNAVEFPGFLERLEEWMRTKEEQATRLTEGFLDFERPGGLWLSLLIVAVIPALGEELLFRGVIQRLLTEWWKNIHWAIIGSSLLFSALHLQFFGFLPRMLMGIWFGYLLVWSRNLWLPIAAHFLNNALIVVFYYLMEKKVIGKEIENIGTGEGSTWLVGASIMITGLLIWQVWFREKIRSERQ